MAAFVAALLLAVGGGVGLGWDRDPVASSPAAGVVPPVVAGAVTSLAPSSIPATTAAPASTSSSVSTATTAATAPVAPATLAVSPATVDLGRARTTATLGLGNGGDEPLSWTAAASAPWLEVDPASGRLDGGERTRLTVSVRRDGLPEGDAGGRVELAWGGPTRSVAVALRVEHPPEIGGLSASPGEIRVGSCTPNSSLIEATVRDESPLASVVLRWGRQEVPMTQRSGSWFARLGPVPTEGTVAWQVVARDQRGNSATASGTPVRASACP